ncbi:hypothetical protein ACWDPV_08475 [Gordonia sp. NPDC003504]
MSDIVVPAGARVFDRDVTVDDADDPERALGAQPRWRREGIVGLIGEAITNSAKHSGTDQVAVHFDRRFRRSTLCDNGTGMFDADTLRDRLAPRALDAMADVEVEPARSRGRRSP